VIFSYLMVLGVVLLAGRVAFFATGLLSGVPMDPVLD